MADQSGPRRKSKSGKPPASTRHDPREIENCMLSLRASFKTLDNAGAKLERAVASNRTRLVGHILSEKHAQQKQEKEAEALSPWLLRHLAEQRERNAEKGTTESEPQRPQSATGPRVAVIQSQRSSVGDRRPVSAYRQSATPQARPLLTEIAEESDGESDLESEDSYWSGSVDITSDYHRQSTTQTAAWASECAGAMHNLYETNSSRGGTSSVGQSRLGSKRFGRPPPVSPAATIRPTSATENPLGWASHPASPAGGTPCAGHSRLGSKRFGRPPPMSPAATTRPTSATEGLFSVASQPSSPAGKAGQPADTLNESFVQSYAMYLMDASRRPELAAQRQASPRVQLCVCSSRPFSAPRTAWRPSDSDECEGGPKTPKNLAPRPPSAPTCSSSKAPRSARPVSAPFGSIAKLQQACQDKYRPRSAFGCLQSYRRSARAPPREKPPVIQQCEPQARSIVDGVDVWTLGKSPS